MTRRSLLTALTSTGATAAVVVTAVIAGGATPAGASSGLQLLAGGSGLDGATVTDGATVSVGGSTTAYVKWIVDGAYVGEDPSAPFTLTLAVAPGRHVLKSRIYDATGNQTRLEATFTVDAAGTPTPTPTSTPTSTPQPAAGRVVRVGSSAALTAALANATAGDEIDLADGTYTAKQQFTLSAACTAAAPCVLKGSRAALLDGAGPQGHYGLHLVGAAYWTLAGFTVTNASKGIVLDGASHDVIDNVDVHGTGDEGIHLRDFSSSDIVRNSSVHSTGLASPQFGEGIYVGSAVSNWPSSSGGKPDNSDRDQIVGNTVWATGAENVDIKEGTTGGTLSSNSFNGAGMSGKNSADSWVDVKGNSWTVSKNVGVDALSDGFQTHVLVAGWGQHNVFRGNVAHVNSTGYGFKPQSAATTGNVVGCDNVVAGAAALRTKHARHSPKAMSRDVGHDVSGIHAAEGCIDLL
jgi:Right handed beta helix region